MSFSFLLHSSEFWCLLSIAGLVYTYFGYPLLLSILERFCWWPVERKDITPRISVVILAHNEAGVIARKIKNILNSQYPNEKMEIIVASDGSDDGTNEIVRGFEGEGVRLNAYPVRRGKPSLMNDAVKNIDSEIIVFCDARQMFAETTIPSLISNFADSSVGGATGLLVFTKDGREGIGHGVDSYWRYESFLREKESGIHSSVGATGALVAVRRELYKPLPVETILDDVVLPLSIIRQGFRVILDKQAPLYDAPSKDWRAEFTRKARTLAGNFQILVHHSRMGKPLSSDIGFEYLSHKVMRLMGPLFLLTAAITSYQLSSESTIFEGLFFVQVAFYFAAAIGWFAEKTSWRIPLCHAPYAFMVIHFAMIIGFFRYISGTDSVRWDREAVVDNALYLKVATIGVDIALIIFAMAMSLLLRHSGEVPQNEWLSFQIVAPWIALIAACVLYTMRIPEKRLLDMEPEFLLRIFSAMNWVTIGLLIIMFITGRKGPSMATLVIPFTYVISVFLLSSWRMIVRIFRWWNLSDESSKQILLVSGDLIDECLLYRLEGIESGRHTCIGVLSEKSMQLVGVRYLGALSNLSVVLASYSIDEVVIQASALMPDEILNITVECDSRNVNYKVIASYFDIISAHSTVDLVNFVPMLEVSDSRIDEVPSMCKRLIDVFVSLFLLIVLLPIFIEEFIRRLIIYRKWPIVSRWRVGQYGSHIKLYRFRVSKNSNKRASRGRVIARLPLLLNIFLGHLSFVGPRAMLPRSVRKLSAWERGVLTLRPGVTGLEQTLSRVHRGMVSRLMPSVFYVRNYSLFLDAKVIMRSVWGMIRVSYARTRREK